MLPDFQDTNYTKHYPSNSVLNFQMKGFLFVCLRLDFPRPRHPGVFWFCFMSDGMYLQTQISTKEAGFSVWPCDIYSSAWFYPAIHRTNTSSLAAYGDIATYFPERSCNSSGSEWLILWKHTPTTCVKGCSAAGSDSPVFDKPLLLSLQWVVHFSKF